jgi:hypothetical protein
MAPMIRHYATLDELPVLNEIPVLSSKHPALTNNRPRAPPIGYVDGHQPSGLLTESRSG